MLDEKDLETYVKLNEQSKTKTIKHHLLFLDSYKARSFEGTQS